MDVMSAIRGRHSVRSFTGDEIPRDVIDELVEAVSLAPSAHNSQPWRLHIATGDTLRRVCEIMSLTTTHVSEYLDMLPAEDRRKAEEFFARVRTGEQKVLILESVIAEAIYVLTKAYGVPRAKAASGLSGLLNYRGASNPDRASLIDALALFGTSRLDIVDCLVIARARREHGALPPPLAGEGWGGGGSKRRRTSYPPP